MLKRLILGGLALVLALAVPANAAGMWPLSFTQRHDLNGKPYPGAKAYFTDAETSDPIDVYREYSLATKHANPVTADGNGVFPAVFVGEQTFYRFRVTTSAGVVLSDTSTIPNVGPTDGEGGDPPEPVEATALARTGDIKARYGVGTIEGWLPMNGLTMGSAISGSNYADDNYEALFTYLWTTDTTLVVVGGRGANAAADWAANKRLTLPDFRGRGMFGLDDMGNSAAGVISGLTTLGEVMSNTGFTLAAANIPQLTTSSNGDHTHTEERPNLTNSFDNGSGSETGASSKTTVNTSSAGAHTHTVGNSSPTAVTGILPPLVGITVYIKI